MGNSSKLSYLHILSSNKASQPLVEGLKIYIMKENHQESINMMQLLMKSFDA